MNEEVGRKIDWWEVLNEREGTYEKEGRLSDLWRLQNMIMLAIRKADPTTKVGGPAMTWPKPSWVESYLKASVTQISFITWHNYASGNASDTNAQVLAKPDTLAGHAADVLKLIPKFAGDRIIETFLTEFNISWSWKTRDPRMVNHLGAVFDAMVVKRLAELGVTGIAKWHVKDGIYGMLGSDNKLRPSGVLYQWSRPMLTGMMVTVDSPRPAEVEALAVQREDGSRSILVINKVTSRAKVGLPTELLGIKTGDVVQIRVIDESTTQSSKAVVLQAVAGEELVVPGYSVTLLTTVPAEVVESTKFY
ncbi:MAG: hypothetical protein HC898_02985 [Phycisphaerales bacterium]|nr:hypothetical protein [Phycisphaerales bacterium]